MSEQLKPEHLISIPPILKRFMTTCHPLEGRVGQAACDAWQSQLNQELRHGRLDLETSLPDLSHPFPHLAEELATHNVEEVVRRYVLGVGEDSHTMNMYLHAKSAWRNLKRFPEAEPQLVSVLHHIYGCSTKPYNTKTAEAHFLGHSFHAPVDLSLLHTDRIPDHVLLHGMNEGGIHVAIAELDVATYALHRNWHEARGHSKGNPFMRRDPRVWMNHRLPSNS